MPATRTLTMRQLRYMLRLAADGTSIREIAEMLGIARSTVQDNLKRAAAAGLSWPLAGDLTDDALENKLFSQSGRPGISQGHRRRPEPNWAQLATELKKPGVTLLILWEEYRAVHPDGYGYSRFCELYRSFERRLWGRFRLSAKSHVKRFCPNKGPSLRFSSNRSYETAKALFSGAQREFENVRRMIVYRTKCGSADPNALPAKRAEKNLKYKGLICLECYLALSRNRPRQHRDDSRKIRRYCGPGSIAR